MSALPSLPPLPRGFAEEERRKFWRRKQDEDVMARLTEQRDAAVAALEALVKVAPTDGDLRDAGWAEGETEAFCDAFDLAFAALAFIKQSGEK